MGEVAGAATPRAGIIGAVIRGLDPRTHSISPPCMGGWVYILASKPYGTLYIGVTSNLVRRTWEHRTGLIPGFTQKYGVKSLVWFETHERIETAIQREHTMKHWNRKWKIDLILAANPDWRDLWEDINSPL